MERLNFSAFAKTLASLLLSRSSMKRRLTSGNSPRNGSLKMSSQRNYALNCSRLHHWRSSLARFTVKSDRNALFSVTYASWKQLPCYARNTTRRWDIDVDEHIQNISSYRLTFFDKLVLCRGLKFSIPQPRISAMDIQAAFEKAYWKLEPTLPDDKKDLARSDPSLDRAQTT